MVDGRRLKAGDKNKIMIGRVLAANLDKKVGDTIGSVRRHLSREVVGIYESPIPVENAGAVVLAQRFARHDEPQRKSPASPSLPSNRSTSGIEDLCKRIEEIDPELLEAKTASEFVTTCSKSASPAASLGSPPPSH